MIFACFTLYELATTSPLEWHLTHLVDNVDTLYLGDHHWQQTVLLFLDFNFFVFHQLACVSIILCVCGSVYNPSQVLKNSSLWGFQLLFSHKMIKMQWLAYDEWGCLLEPIQITDKKVLIGHDIYVIFCSGLELKEV